MNSPRHTSPQQSGFSMIEVLVTLIILLVGLLGLAGLMVQSQRSEMESYQRVQALVLLQDMAARLNANRLAAQSCYNFTAAGGAPYVGEGSTLASPATPALATAITDATCTQANIIANAKAELNITTLNQAPAGSQAAMDAQATYATAVTSATAAAPAAVSTALADLRDWHNALLGAAEKTQGGANAGALVNARGCISYDATQETQQLQDNGLPTGVQIPGTGIYTVSVAWQGKGDTFIPALTCGQNQYTSEMSRRVVSLTFRIASLR